MDYPETENLRRDFLGHKNQTGLSFVQYAKLTSISRRTLLEFSANRIRPLYETGKKLEMWLSENPSSFFIKPEALVLDKGYCNP